MPAKKTHHMSKFGKLSGSVAREYERKGVSPARAKKIGKAVAGKVAREKHGKGK